MISQCVLALVAATSFAGPPVEVKDIAAPPEDILSGRVRMPDPSTCAATSCTALLPLEHVTAGERRIVRGDGKALVALLADHPEDWNLTLEVGSGERFIQSELHDAGPVLPGALARVALVDPQATEVEIQVTPPDAEAVGWMLLADGQEDIKLRTHFDTHSFLVGAPVIVRTEVVGADLLEAEVTLRSPTGVTTTRTVTQNNSRRGSALLQADTPGNWTVQTIARVRDASGQERLRTTQQLIQVERPEVVLNGVVSLEQSDQGLIELSVPVTVLGVGEVAETRRVAVGCEIWGRTTDGSEVPVCWVARMNSLQSNSGAGVLGLRCDPRWLDLAQVEPDTLMIRELRIQDAEGFVPFVYEPEPVSIVTGSIQTPKVKISEIPKDMLAGRSGNMVEGMESVNTLSAGGHVMLISHGYCTDIFPWTTSDFSGDVELFIDFDQNVSHDTFALRFESLGRNFKSMGITGHSQGGNAAAHLYTFYWSSLDWATGNRRIQGVGVPWLGTALASDVAVLGEIFGVGCGSNFDLTYDGSALWISWIPTWVRQETWYWTTSFEDFTFWYDYCQIVSDVLLSDPDDGVIERWAGQLEGGNNGGHKEAWCHTRSMRDPPQCTDGSRNSELNTESAR